MDYIDIILTIVALAGFIGAAAGAGYGARQKAVIETLELSNKAYKERNGQLEEDIRHRDQEYAKIKEAYNDEITHLKGRVHTLEKLKTPPLDELIELIVANHSKVITAIEKANTNEPRT